MECKYFLSELCVPAGDAISGQMGRLIKAKHKGPTGWYEGLSVTQRQKRRTPERLTIAEVHR